MDVCILNFIYIYGGKSNQELFSLLFFNYHYSYHSNWRSLFPQAYFSSPKRWRITKRFYGVKGEREGENTSSGTDNDLTDGTS